MAKRIRKWKWLVRRRRRNQGLEFAEGFRRIKNKSTRKHILGLKYTLFVWLCKQLFQQAFLGKQSTKIKFDIFRKNVRLRIIIHLHKGKGPHKTLLKLAESNSINKTIYTLSIECCFFDISHQLMRKAALSDLLQ